MCEALVASGVLERTPDGRYKLTREAWQGATRGTRYEERGAYHFVGFKDDRWWNAMRAFGRPDYIHRFWDRRAVDEVAVGDVVVFAEGDEMQEVKEFAYDDSAFF